MRAVLVLAITTVVPLHTGSVLANHNRCQDANVYLATQACNRLNSSTSSSTSLVQFAKCSLHYRAGEGFSAGAPVLPRGSGKGRRRGGRDRGGEGKAALDRRVSGRDEQVQQRSGIYRRAPPPIQPPPVTPPSSHFPPAGQSLPHGAPFSYSHTGGLPTSNGHYQPPLLGAPPTSGYIFTFDQPLQHSHNHITFGSEQSPPRYAPSAPLDGGMLGAARAKLGAARGRGKLGAARGRGKLGAARGRGKLGKLPPTGHHYIFNGQKYFIPAKHEDHKTTVTVGSGIWTINGHLVPKPSEERFIIGGLKYSIGLPEDPPSHFTAGGTKFYHTGDQTRKNNRQEPYPPPSVKAITFQGKTYVIHGNLGSQSSEHKNFFQINGQKFYYSGHMLEFSLPSPPRGSHRA